jgi:hypothetical protein
MLSHLYNSIAIALFDTYVIQFTWAIPSSIHALVKHKDFITYILVSPFLKNHLTFTTKLSNSYLTIHNPFAIVKTPLLVVDKDNHLSKPNFYLSVLQMKSSSTCLITASLCDDPFFYFYVESPPSTFMHHLREHSCHSEFNVHSPIVYHWLIYDYGFTCS